MQPLSLDEAYLDVTACSDFGGSATLIAKHIRDLIQAETGLTASAGIAPNKFLAKIASDWNKPKGQFVIRPEDIDNFMLKLQVEKMHGVGKVTAKKMHDLGLRTCGDLQKQSLLQLSKWFGSWAKGLSDMARGIDERPVHSHTERKSLSVEETYREDVTILTQALKKVPALYEDWERRMLRGDYRDKIRGYVVKLKFTDFKSTTHETTSKTWPKVEDFQTLLTQAWSRREKPVRLIGIGVRLKGDEAREESAQLSFVL